MYSMYQSGIDSPLFNMSCVISTKTGQSVLSNQYLYSYVNSNTEMIFMIFLISVAATSIGLSLAQTASLSSFYSQFVQSSQQVKLESRISMYI